MKKYEKSLIAAVIPLAVAIGSSPAVAGGLFGDAINVFVPGAGTYLDERHHEFKMANPSYGQWEEQTTNNVRSRVGLRPHCTDIYDKWGNHRGCM